MSTTSILIEKFLKGDLTEDERKKLKKWVLAKEEHRAFFKTRIREHDRTSFTAFDAENAFQRFSAIIDKRKSGTRFPVTLLKYAAVFAILLALGLLMRNNFMDENAATEKSIAKDHTNPPKEEGIVLKLEDGSTQKIDSKSDGIVEDAQGNVVANKAKDQLRFESDGEEENAPIRYNEIFIPNGQKFKIQLSDGTWVWLNSGSKLRFPQQFASSSQFREVYLEGEAFFDVTKDAQKPFLVNTENINIEVLGTRFNLSAYGSDDAIATTLVEGAVKVYETDSPKNGMRLDPSYQAHFSKSTQSFGKRKVDTDLYTAWMQNKLIINDLTFPEILKKLERTHNVTFVNKAPHLKKEVYQGEFQNESIIGLENHI